MYFSESDQVEQWLEAGLSSHLRVEFMGPISYYLGVYFRWFMDKEDELAVHISQPNYIAALLEHYSFNLKEVHTAHTPFWSGFPIDSVNRYHKLSEAKHTQYRALVGSLGWLAQSTRMNIAVAYACLTTYQDFLSPGHYEAALHVL